MEKFTILTASSRRSIVQMSIPTRSFEAIPGVDQRTGFAQGLFADWRKDPGFVLNQPRYEGARISRPEKLRLRSSREHAPWALMEYGFRSVIAPSFADIFFNNSSRTACFPWC